ncbi:DsbA family protein [Candidatus Uhrbacteria bacterium]|nr:DsbA family protein [Candidatus Uhrbacteria bacterium]
MNDQQMRKLFLLGTLGFGAIIIAGLVWAIAAGPDAPNQNRGTDETGLEFNDDNDPFVGPGESKAVVRVFSDFQCPACKTAEPAFKAATEKFGDRVKFVWNDFPLSSIHPNARAAAVAARCAEDQGKFWEYHDRLFQEQEAWSGLSAPTASFVGYAGDLGLNKDSFTSCLVNQPGMHKIQADETEGNINKVQGTPTFFIGNRRFVGIVETGVWEQELTRLLQNP